MSEQGRLTMNFAALYSTDTVTAKLTVKLVLILECIFGCLCEVAGVFLFLPFRTQVAVYTAVSLFRIARDLRLIVCSFLGSTFFHFWFPFSSEPILCLIVSMSLLLSRELIIWFCRSVTWWYNVDFSLSVFRSCCSSSWILLSLSWTAESSFCNLSTFSWRSELFWWPMSIWCFDSTAMVLHNSTFLWSFVLVFESSVFRASLKFMQFRNAAYLTFTNGSSFISITLLWNFWMRSWSRERLFDDFVFVLDVHCLAKCPNLLHW